MSDDLFKDTQLGVSQQSDCCIIIVTCDHLIANSEVISPDASSQENTSAGLDKYILLIF